MSFTYRLVIFEIEAEKVNSPLKGKCNVLVTHDMLATYAA